MTDQTPDLSAEEFAIVEHFDIHEQAEAEAERDAALPKEATRG